MLKIYLPQTLINVAARGGGLDIDCSQRIITPELMTAIAAAAASSGRRPTIIFRNVPMILPETMERVADAGEGCVMFVI